MGAGRSNRSSPSLGSAGASVAVRATTHGRVEAGNRPVTRLDSERLGDRDQRSAPCSAGQTKFPAKAEYSGSWPSSPVLGSGGPRIADRELGRMAREEPVAEDGTFPSARTGVSMAFPAALVWSDRACVGDRKRTCPLDWRTDLRDPASSGCMHCHRPWRGWISATPYRLALGSAYSQIRSPVPADQLGEYGRGYMDALSRMGDSMLRFSSELNKPDQPIFTNDLIVLVDERCGSACEDFAMPLKFSGRATLIGRSTTGSSGQPYMFDFGNGMSFRISTKRQCCPDGSTFEGSRNIPGYRSARHG